MMNNTDQAFVDVRMKALERHINKLLENPFIRKDNLMKDFLIMAPKEFEDLKKSNSKQTAFSLGALKETILSDPSQFSNLFKVISKSIVK